MTTKVTPPSTVDRENEVMTSIDDTDAETRVVIADITRDNVWISMSLSDAASLPDWR